MRIAVLFALAALLGTGSAAAEQFYKWKDADGVTHYTNTPPPAGVQADKLAVKPAPLAADPAAPTESAPADGSSGTPADGRSTAAAAQRSAACATAQTTLNTLKSNAFVTMDKDGDGVSELLSPEEQNAQIGASEERVRTLCGNPGQSG
jgi:hypothetical protein